MLNGKLSVALGYGACLIEQLCVRFAFCHQCMLPRNMETCLALFAMSEQNLQDNHLFLQFFSVKHEAFAEFCPFCVAHQFIPLPCVLVWQSKHCKVQEGPKKKVCQVIRFDEGCRNRPFIGSCRRGCVWLQRLLKAQLLFSAHTWTFNTFVLRVKSCPCSVMSYQEAAYSCLLQSLTVL